MIHEPVVCTVMQKCEAAASLKWEQCSRHTGGTILFIFAHNENDIQLGKTN